MNKHKQKKPSPVQGGFTLIESMVALLVLGIGVLGILQFLTGSIKSNTLNNPRAVAVHNAGERLAELYGAAADGPAVIKTQLNELINGFSPPDAKFNYTVTAVAALDNNSKNIIITAPDGTVSVDNDETSWSSPITMGVKIHYQIHGEDFAIYVPQTLVFEDN